MTPEPPSAGTASLKRELLARHERRRMVETDPELTAKECAKQLRDHDRLILRLLDQLTKLEGH